MRYAILNKVIKRSLTERGDKAKTYTTLYLSEEDTLIVQFERYFLSKKEYKGEDVMKKFKENTLYRDEFSIKYDTLVISLNQLLNPKK